MDTSVLFLGFNRPDLATLVLDRLRECGVRRLYIALDGPRSGHPTDTEQCRLMRDLVDTIQWAENKVMLIREENLGCGLAVSSALNWFFHQEEKGIIIEDDCLPDPSFFQFCEEMLNRYADHSEIWAVAGTSLIPESTVPAQSHFFSKYSGIWGWATWRRAWQTYSYDLSCLTAEEWKKVVEQKCVNAVERRYWLHILDLMLKGEIDTWDFQVQFCSWKANALHVTSSVNLVQNLGFRPDGTHTKEVSSLSDRRVMANLPPYALLPVEADTAIDRIVFGERLHASRELSEWLFDQENLEKLSDITKQQNCYISELEDHLNRRAMIIADLEASLKTRSAEIDILRNESTKHLGLLGALRCIRNGMNSRRG